MSVPDIPRLSRVSLPRAECTGDCLQGLEGHCMRTPRRDQLPSHRFALMPCRAMAHHAACVVVLRRRCLCCHLCSHGCPPACPMPLQLPLRARVADGMLGAAADAPPASSLLPSHRSPAASRPIPFASPLLPPYPPPPPLPCSFENGSLLTTADGGISLLAGRCLGGGSTVNWSASFKTPPHVTNEWASEYGLKVRSRPHGPPS